MRASDTRVQNGKLYYSVRAAARELSVTANKLREMMGRGDLELTQFGVNGPLWIAVESIVSYQRRKETGE